MKSELASGQTGSRTQLPALATGLVLMAGLTAYPRFVVDSTGRADHLLAVALLWAMTAGFVRGVGFVPRTRWIRWIFSGQACLAALVGAVVIKAFRMMASA